MRLSLRLGGQTAICQVNYTFVGVVDRTKTNAVTVWQFPIFTLGEGNYYYTPSTTIRASDDFSKSSRTQRYNV